MPHDNNTPRFPYQHLAVLGMEKLKKYVPPASSDTSRASAPRLDAAQITSTSKSNGTDK
jgi:hypothetical protein